MPGGRSVHRRVGGHAGHQGIASALAGQHLRPQAARLRREGILELRRLEDPVASLELAVELARAPAGMAEKRSAGANPSRELLLRGARTEYADVVEGEQGRVGRVLELSQDDYRRGLDG